MMKAFCITILGLLITIAGFGQESSNLTRFTPSALLSQGQYEIQNFNNLYTQKSVRNAKGQEIDLNQRQLFLNSMFMFTYGVSAKSKLNVGIDFNINRARYINSTGKALSIFGSNNGDYTRTILSSIAPRIKFSPISGLPRLSIQSSLSIPIAGNQEIPRFVAHDRYNWWTQIFFDRSFGSHWQLFFELDFLYRFRNQDFQENFFRTPASVFVSYFPTPKLTFYTMFLHSPAFGKTNLGGSPEFGRLRWFNQWGIGSKYQLTTHLGIELSYSDFFASRNDGAGKTVNFGLRFIK